MTAKDSWPLRLSGPKSWVKAAQRELVPLLQRISDPYARIDNKRRMSTPICRQAAECGACRP
jgi:hypothetical protein